jgi:hypothetical protein
LRLVSPVRIGAIGRGVGLVGYLFLAGLASSSATCATDSSARNRADWAAYGCAHDAASDSATRAARARAYLVVIALGSVSRSSATCATDARADGCAYGATHGSADEATGHSAARAAYGFVSLVVAGPVAAVSGHTVRVNGFFSRVARAFACRAADRAANHAADRHTDGAADSAQGRTGRRTRSAAANCANLVTGIIAFGRTGCTGSRRATNGRAQADAQGSGHSRAYSSACHRACRATRGLTGHAGVVAVAVGCAVAIVGVIVICCVAAHITRARAVQDVAGCGFLAVRYACGNEHAAPLHAGLVESRLFFGHACFNQRAYEAAGSSANARAYQCGGEGSGSHYGAYAGDSERADAYEQAREAAQHATAYSARYRACTAATRLCYDLCAAGCVGLHCHAYIACGDVHSTKLLNGHLGLISTIE